MTNAVMSGAKARIIAIAINDGSQEVAPNSASEGRDCLVKTIPVIKAVSVMIGSEFHPME
jgi:hypothetical protein